MCMDSRIKEKVFTLVKDENLTNIQAVRRRVIEYVENDLQKADGVVYHVLDKRFYPSDEAIRRTINIAKARFGFLKEKDVTKSKLTAACEETLLLLLSYAKQINSIQCLKIFNSALCDLKGNMLHYF